MQPTTPAGTAWLDAVRADPAHALLAFDFDGTLAPIVADPDAAAPHPDAHDALADVAAQVGHVAVITGRPAGVAAARLGLADLAGHGDVRVLGHYGLERWDAVSGEVQAPAPDPGLARVRRELSTVLAGADTAAAFVEDKGSAVAVHTRRLPDPAAALDRLRGPLAELAAAAGLVVEPGRLVLELRPHGIDKGGALRALVAETGARAVSFAGDDLGDVAAFDAVDAMRADGIAGLLVCSGSSEERALADRADLLVDGPAGVVAWLRDLSRDLADRT